ncbi:MAG TPA: methionine--tRNA ligase [Terriglobales bacterium]|nr:methionine--tRNA ligase [Terriglobales bacterium]
MAKFYITTPIYYVNARPHLGHAYTTIVCDTIARRHRMLGDDTFFLTGTDEHGVNVERAAQAAGRDPQAHVDEIAAAFRATADRVNASYDKFIRTTSAEHKRGAQALFQVLQEKGFIYKGHYSGQYCVFDNLYVDAVGPGAPCPECGRPTETVSEENYFFKLSAFEDKLLKYYHDHPEFIRPDTRRNEVISFVRGGLKDLSISRSTFQWGVPVPGDPGHVMYVWLDALSNYITAIGYGSPEKQDQERFRHYWPANVHMIGKEIVRFHCVYWPAFLMAAGLELPRSIVAHGWLLFEHDKMSKSRGNIVRAETIIDVLGVDALRYFLLREVVFGSDGSFSFDALVQRYNSDLANDYGNLSSRTLSMIGRYFKGEVPYPSPGAARTPADEEIAEKARQAMEECAGLFAQFQFSRALECAWSVIGAVNKYIVDNEPWSVAEKQDEHSRARLATILYTSAEALRVVTALVHPVIPDSTARIWRQLGLGEISDFRLTDLKWGQLQLGGKLGKVEPVFPRADKSAIDRMHEAEAAGRAAAPVSPKASGESRKPPAAVAAAPEQAAAQAAGTPAGTGAHPGQPATQAAVGPSASAPAPSGKAAKAAAPPEGKISIDDFVKVEMRVALVKHAERVKGADKLLRLEVDLGTEQRQIVAGIAEAYEPEKLIGRKIVIVANLAPRKLRGLESNGMLLAASVEGGKPALASFLEDVPVGARLK